MRITARFYVDLGSAWLRDALGTLLASPFPKVAEDLSLVLWWGAWHEESGHKACACEYNIRGH